MIKKRKKEKESNNQISRYSHESPGGSGSFGLRAEGTARDRADALHVGVGEIGQHVLFQGRADVSPT